MKSLFDIVPDGYVNPDWETCPVVGRPWWDSPQCRRDGECGHDPEDVDEKHPLPHPGYRVGQIWAWRSPPGRTVYGPLRDAAELERALDRHATALYAEIDIALLYDPLFPKAAPWTGTWGGR